MNILKRFLLLISLFVYSYAYTDNTHHWTRTNPGGGGAIAMVGATPSGVILAASDLSGVYRSKDKGKSWDVLGANNGLLDTHINVLGFHTKNSNIFFIGTGHGLYRTENGGDRIYKAKLETRGTATKTSKPDGYIESIAMAFDKPSVGYLAHYEYWLPEITFMKTTDDGKHWKIVRTQGLPPKAVIVKIVINKQNSKLIYAVTGKARFRCGPAQLYKSEDGGRHWQRIGKNIGDILDIDLHPNDTQKIYVSTFHANPCNIDEDGKTYEYFDGETSFEGYIADADNMGSLYTSNNAGKHFSKLTDRTGIISVSNEQPETIRLVDIFNPYDWNDDSGTWESTNAGKTWSQKSKATDWFAGYSAAQYFTYSLSYHGLSKTLIKDIFNTNNFYASFGSWAWASFDAGKHVNNVSTKQIAKDQWLSTGVENINGNALDVNNANPNIIYMGGYDIGFWYSKNHGASWTRSLPDFNKYSKYLWDVGKVPVKKHVAIRGGGANINTLISDPKREAVVWATFSKAQYNGEGALFKSNAYGENWKKVGKGLPAGDAGKRIFGLSIDETSPVKKRTLYITVSGSVYKSVDDGLSWKLVLSAKKTGGLKFTQVDKFDGRLVFAGGEGGLWRSPDAGKNWKEIGGKYISEFRNSNKNSRKDIVPTYSDGSFKAWQGVFDIKTDPNKKFRVYVTAYGKNKGLYRSDNAGQSFKKLLKDDDMRGVAISPTNPNIIYASSSKAYHSGGQGNSAGILFSSNGGKSWKNANANMPWKYAGRIDIETGKHPNVWLWSPGTGIQYSPIP